MFYNNMLFMKNKLDLIMVSDSSDPDALWKLWITAAPGVWDGYIVDEELPRGATYSSGGINIEPKCECGTHSTYGKDCIASLHSSWCLLFKEEL